MKIILDKGKLKKFVPGKPVLPEILKEFFFRLKGNNTRYKLRSLKRMKVIGKSKYLGKNGRLFPF